MSDFEITMRDWKRLCDSMQKKYGFHSCENCPVYLFDCSGIYKMPANTDWRLLEEKVDAWAEEHPEPVYPTWAEWLEEMGLTRRSVTAARRILGTDSSQETAIPFIVTLSINAYNPIPADIAEKLGLRPKGEDEND